jgi:hypothetical protein
MSAMYDCQNPFGYVDWPIENTLCYRAIELYGWASPPNNIRQIEVLANGQIVGCSELGASSRPGVANAYPSIPNAEQSGFSIRLYIVSQEGIYELIVQAVTANGDRSIIGKMSIINSKGSVITHREELISNLSKVGTKQELLPRQSGSLKNKLMNFKINYYTVYTLLSISYSTKLILHPTI